MNNQQQKYKTESLNEIGQNLVPGALNDIKKIRKASADCFANIGPETSEPKPGEKANNHNTNPNKFQNSSDSG